MSNPMITVKEAAALWGVSVRRAQELCRQGRVRGAVLFGKNWMIPADAPRPEDGRGRRGEELRALPRHSPLLYMTDLYHSPGCAARASAELVEHPIAKLLFDAGIAYCRGEIERAYTLLYPRMGEISGFYAMAGVGLILSFCAVWRGDSTLWDEVMHYIARIPVKDEQERELLTLVHATAKGELLDFRGYPQWFDRGDFGILPHDSHAAANAISARYLYAVAYGVAIRELSYPGIEGLGMMGIIPYSIEGMINRAVAERTVIPEIHLRMWCATAYHNVGRDALAITHIDRAIALALPDGLLGILAEHYRPLDNLLDDRLGVLAPEAQKTVRELQRVYFANQSDLRKRIVNRNVAVNLTTREREIAKKVAFGMTNKAIAKALGIGESTVKSTVRNIMQKTNITDRSDFVMIL